MLFFAVSKEKQTYFFYLNSRLLPYYAKCYGEEKVNEKNKMRTELNKRKSYFTFLLHREIEREIRNSFTETHN